MTAFDPDHPVSMTKPLLPAPGDTVALPPPFSASGASAPFAGHAGYPPVAGYPGYAPVAGYPGYAPVAGYPPFAGPPAASPSGPYSTVAMPRQSNAEIVVAWVFTALTLLYMLPWAIAATRRSTNSVLIAVATFFLAWTGLGWLVLLVLSFLGPTVNSLRPVVAFAPPALPGPPPAGAWGQHPADPPHVRRWWDGHAWTAHTTTV